MLLEQGRNKSLRQTFGGTQCAPKKGNHTKKGKNNRKGGKRHFLPMCKHRGIRDASLMISYTNSPNKFVCNSSDTKPTDFSNGAVMREMDTGITFMFDQDNSTWYEQNSGSGGGSTYVLPLATDLSLGGVKALPATAEQTEQVGIDAEGRLFTKPFNTNSINGLQTVLDGKQTQSNLLRIGAADYHLNSNEYTDIFAVSGSIIFDTPFNGKNIKTFYIGKGVELKQGTYTAMTKINVDYTEKTLPYTTDAKMFLVGYTLENTPLFTRSGLIPFPEVADNGKMLKVGADNQFVLADSITKVSDLTNDSNFVDSTVGNLANYYLKSETFTKAEVNGLLGALNSISFSVVAEKPATGLPNIIYLVPVAGSTDNTHDEWVWANSAWEKIGDTKVDLSNYYNKTEVDTELAKKQNKSNLKRVQVDAGQFFSLDTDEYTDIFAITGGVEFTAGFTGKQIKTFYVNEGVVLKAGAGSVIENINVDFSQISITGAGYTVPQKIYLVGYTADNIPLFTHVYQLPQATVSALGGIIADSKSAVETNEVKIDTSTGKLFSAGTTAVQATGDSTTAIMSQNAVTNELNGKVGKVGDEDIGGVKNFTSNIKVNEINSNATNHPLKLAAPVVELESRGSDGTSVIAKVSLAGSNNPSTIPHTLYPWSDNDTDLGTANYKFKDLYIGGKINELTLPTGAKTIATMDDLSDKQTKYKYGRFNSGTNNITEADDYTDIFVMGGDFGANETALHGLKTLYLNKGVQFVAGTNVDKINIDFTERQLPYTIPNKMHLVGFTQTNCPLFITDHAPMEIALAYTSEGTGSLSTEQQAVYDSAQKQDITVTITGFNNGVN